MLLMELCPFFAKDTLKVISMLLLNAFNVKYVVLEMHYQLYLIGNWNLMFLYLNACVENINLICEQFTVPFLVTLYHEIAWSCRHNDAIEVKKRIVQNSEVKDLMRTIAPGHRSLLGFLINVANFTQYHGIKFAYS